MGYLLNLFESIPGSVWGTLFGACITLVVVVLTNRAHDRRLQTQLDQDRELKNREREMALRKEIYLAAAEAVHTGMIAINRFANLSIPHDNLIDSYTNKATSIAKIHVIGKDETLTAVLAFSATLDATFLRLFAKRGPLVLLNQKIDTLKARVNASLKENSRMLELMTQHNIDGIADQRRMEILYRNFEFEHRRGEEADKEADALKRALYVMQLQLMEDAMEEKNKLVSLLIPVICLIRKELELPLEDEDGYRRVVEGATSQQIQIFKDYLQQQRNTEGPSP